MVAILVFSSQDVGLGLESPGSGPLALLAILGGLLVASVAVLLGVGRLRRAARDRLRVWWPQVRSSLGALRAPHKLGLLLGCNLATEVLFALALGLMTRGFGYEIPLATLILINSGTSLLSSLIPVPGGVGVTEFALEVGLTSAGMTPTAALAAILLYRAATFYVPPLWGFFAFRWLQRNRYL